MLLLKGIGKVFYSLGRNYRALDGVSMEANAGDVVGIAGPNGAGKTTLLRIITTAIRASEGEGTVNGFDLKKDAASVREQIGFVTGDFALYSRLTGFEYLRYFGRLNRMGGRAIESRIEELSTRFNMHGFIHRRCGGYSAGMRQKICISRAILHRPPVLLLDEATSNLDIESSGELTDLVTKCAQDGAIVLYTTHRIHELEKLCNKLIVIFSGRPAYWGDLSNFSAASNGSIGLAYQQLYERLKAETPVSTVVN